jgi:hypothetical protein
MTSCKKLIEVALPLEVIKKLFLSFAPNLADSALDYGRLGLLDNLACIELLCHKTQWLLDIALS